MKILSSLKMREKWLFSQSQEYGETFYQTFKLDMKLKKLLVSTT